MDKYEEMARRFAEQDEGRPTTFAYEHLIARALRFADSEREKETCKWVKTSEQLPETEIATLIIFNRNGVRFARWREWGGKWQWETAGNVLQDGLYAPMPFEMPAYWLRLSMPIEEV